MVKLIFLFICFLDFELSIAQSVNYANISNWAVHPNKIPGGLLPYMKDTTNFSKADVFYVYPTLFLDKKDERWNIPIDDT
ncbi:MAG: hypothetical protein ACKO7P_11515, partial [Bacteroidota bacterium]